MAETSAVGLSEPAMTLVQALQQPRQSGNEQLLRLFESEVAQTIEQLRAEQTSSFAIIGETIVER